MSKKKQYYIVVKGHNPGIYTQWFGEDGAADQVKGVPDAVYKGFYTREEAVDWLAHFSRETLAESAPNLLDHLPATQRDGQSQDAPPPTSPSEVVIFTDGGALRNPGPGGYGVVLRYKTYYKELSGGFRRTTNNRMELLACIEALNALKHPSDVILHSDSQYVVNGIMKGWAKRWRAKGWMRTKTERPENVDLWEQLLALCEQHRVRFQWVKGHAGNPDNERCDQLATEAAQAETLDIDENYEQGRTQMPASELLQEA